jgi:hypothetical protein
MDLNLFYSALAAATATLLGLLFVAIQLNMERLLKEPTGQWKALAVSTFQTYVLLLIVSLFSFMPLLRGTCDPAGDRAAQLVEAAIPGSGGR